MGHHKPTHPITFRGSGWEYMVQIESPSTPECQEGVPSPVILSEEVIPMSFHVALKSPLGILSQTLILSSPGPKPLAPKPKPRGLGLTLECCRPPPPTHHPPTFKHEGGVPQQNSKSKNILEWSPLLVQQKNLCQRARERTWSSLPYSVRTSSILLVASLSK